MSRNKPVVPNARQALEQFKIEIAQELGVDGQKSQDSSFAGYTVRKLIEMGEQQLIDTDKNN